MSSQLSLFDEEERVWAGTQPIGESILVAMRKLRDSELIEKPIQMIVSPQTYDQFRSVLSDEHNLTVDRFCPNDKIYALGSTYGQSTVNINDNEMTLAPGNYTISTGNNTENITVSEEEMSREIRILSGTGAAADWSGSFPGTMETSGNSITVSQDTNIAQRIHEARSEYTCKSGLEPKRLLIDSKSYLELAASDCFGTGRIVGYPEQVFGLEIVVIPLTKYLKVLGDNEDTVFRITDPSKLD